MFTYKEFRNIFHKAFSAIVPDKEIAEEYNKQSPETSPIYPNQRIKMLIF